MALGFLLCAGPSFAVESTSFDTQGSFEPTATRLKALVAIQLISPLPVYAARVTARSSNATQLLSEITYWAPATRRTIAIDLPAVHQKPGRYYLILQFQFSDAAFRRQHAAIALAYHVGGSEKPATESPAPTVTLSEHDISWSGLRPSQNNLQLDLTVGPFWTNEKTYTPQDRALDLHTVSNNAAPPLWVFQQLSRLTWTENGVHYSTIQSWSIVTDTDGAWHSTPAKLPAGPIRTSEPIAASAFFALGLLATTALFGGLRLKREGQPALTARRYRYIGVLCAIGITFWLAHATHPELWFSGTWTTGGDTASHMFYASVFNDWFWSGKISGWLPESFAGFPAFTYYFPFPFALSALLSVPFGLQNAFKLISTAPAVLLPAATYAMVSLMRWPVTARIFALVGSTGFLLTTTTTIWGGNALSTFTGEFAYGWSMMAAALFLAALYRTFTDGGRWWLVAALLEAATALSHGYPLLVIGFGSFGMLLSSAKSSDSLRTLLQIHALAFLLIAVWMFPLIENLPWTLPNDTTLWVDNFEMLWPKELWPLSVGLIAIAFIIRRKTAELGQFAPIASFALMALLGFSIADRIGLAAVRFYPLLQWALCVMLAGAIGFALERWNTRPLWWALTASFATLWWCQPGLEKVSDWANWNLSGYETKPLWPVYREVANHLRGPLSAPRVLFEHDPANYDIGSNRGLEALPLFGTRPIMEGLYMESALTGPFIYQTQSEVSEHPSSPLSHYRSVPTNVDQALAHMKELYSDTLLLRSDSMKEKFRADPRLEFVADIDPFLILKIKNAEQHMVEPIAVPLSPQSRTGWLEDAFARFRLAHPYQTRRVYLADDQAAPAVTAPTQHAQAKLIEFDRERLVFETNAIGQPHLIRMTYHPRWRSTTGEPVFLTEPSFMLVVPQQARVELVYGDTLANTLGRIGSLLGVAFVLFVLVLNPSCKVLCRIDSPRWITIPPQPSHAHSHAARNWIIVTSLIGTISATAWWITPDRAFFAGHALLAKKDYAAAAARFEQAAQDRTYRASKAEALFWAARSYDMGADHKRAIDLYEAFRKTYPETYSYPESTYRLIVLYQNREQHDDVRRVLAELKTNAPGNKWTKKAETFLGSS